MFVILYQFGVCAYVQKNNSLLQSFEWNFASHTNTNKWVFAKDALNVNNKSPKWNNNMLSEQTLWKHWKARLVAVVVVVVDFVHFSCNARTFVPPKSHTSWPRFVCSLFISQSQVILKHRETFFIRIAQCTLYIFSDPFSRWQHSKNASLELCTLRFSFLFCSSFIIAPERMTVNSFVPVIILRDSSLTILCASLWLIWESWLRCR